MKTLKDLKLRKATKERVQEWLKDWLELFIAQADGRQGNVYRADFQKGDFFYFTNCNDILAKDPECKARETNPKIIKRKQRIMLQLLIKTLLGENVGKKIKCTHCGYEDREINSIYNGHYTYCPKCQYLTINGYLDTMAESTKQVLAKLTEKEQKQA